MAQPTLNDLLQQPIDGATRLIVHHERIATFRWLGVLEMVLIVGAFCCCIVPVMIVLTILSGGGNWDSDTELFRWNRLFHHWHDLIFTAFDGNGQVIASRRVRLLTEQQGDPLLASIIQAADRQGVIVIETIGAKAAAATHLWYGGRPLLAEPGLPTGDRTAQRLESLDCVLSYSDEETTLRYQSPPTPTGMLVLKVAGLGLVFPLLLVKDLREMFSVALAELQGKGPPVFHLRVRVDEVAARREQGDKLLGEQRIAGHRIVGFAWSRELTYGDQAEIVGPHLRVALIDGIEQLHVPSDLGAVLRDFLTRETLDHRARRPELGLTHGDPPATRCPYCGALYIFEPGTGCPSCGGWPDKVG